jgi:hypothetical protein
VHLRVCGDAECADGWVAQACMYCRACWTRRRRRRSLRRVWPSTPVATRPTCTRTRTPHPQAPGPHTSAARSRLPSWYGCGGRRWVRTTTGRPRCTRPAARACSLHRWRHWSRSACWGRSRAPLRWPGPTPHAGQPRTCPKPPSSTTTARATPSWPTQTTPRRTTRRPSCLSGATPPSVHTDTHTHTHGDLPRHRHR